MQPTEAALVRRCAVALLAAVVACNGQGPASDVTVDGVDATMMDSWAAALPGTWYFIDWSANPPRTTSDVLTLNRDGTGTISEGNLSSPITCPFTWTSGPSRPDSGLTGTLTIMVGQCTPGDATASVLSDQSCPLDYGFFVDRTDRLQLEYISTPSPCQQFSGGYSAYQF
jgi:hypothetical protein